MYASFILTRFIPVALLSFFGIYLSLCFLPSPVHALDPFVSLSITPPYPSGGETVSLQVTSYGIDLSSATITWYINGVQTEKAVGLTQKTLVARAGKTDTISAVITGRDGTTVEKSILLSPSDVDIVWEAIDSYTHPFYKGKALPSSGGSIRVVAIPHIINASGSFIPESELVYTWSIDGFKRDVMSQSGYGKHTLSLVKNILTEKETVSVDINSRDGSRSAGGSVSIISTEPEVLIYEHRPLLGIWYAHAVVDQLRLFSSEMSLIVEPFFFSLPTKNTNFLQYTWTMNGKRIPTDAMSPRSAIFGVPQGVSGNTSVSVNITHPLSLFQSAVRRITVIFENETGSGMPSSFSF